MRLGILGGSFDPVHQGHLELARCCRDQANLDQVLFVPASIQPHKPRGTHVSDADRLEMLNRAIRGEASFHVSTLEIDRGGVSYTIDTLGALSRRNPEAQLFLLMGADTLHDLPNWRAPDEILRLATPLVAHRAGERAANFHVLAPRVDGERLAAIQASRVEMPGLAISSRELRQRISQGKDVSDALPASVREWIETRRLYR